MSEWAACNWLHCHVTPNEKYGWLKITWSGLTTNNVYWKNSTYNYITDRNFGNSSTSVHATTHTYTHSHTGEMHTTWRGHRVNGSLQEASRHWLCMRKSSWMLRNIYSTQHSSAAWMHWCRQVTLLQGRTCLQATQRHISTLGWHAKVLTTYHNLCHPLKLLSKTAHKMKFLLGDSYKHCCLSSVAIAHFNHRRHVMSHAQMCDVTCTNTCVDWGESQVGDDQCNHSPRWE